MKFPLEVLSELRWVKPGKAIDGLTLVETQMTGNRRWVIEWVMVFEYEGKFYSVGYDVGATEMQDMTDEDEFGCWGSDEVECIEVVPAVYKVTKYIPVPA